DPHPHADRGPVVEAQPHGELQADPASDSDAEPDADADRDRYPLGRAEPTADRPPPDTPAAPGAGEGVRPSLEGPRSADHAERFSSRARVATVPPL
ncbi:hypothetical protein ADK51_13095, partial [Streptomyces sp. WM6368]